MAEPTIVVYDHAVGFDYRPKRFPPDAPGDNERKTIMEIRQHPTHPVRELALQLSCGHLLPDDTTESIVDRAEKYAAFLDGAD